MRNVFVPVYAAAPLAALLLSATSLRAEPLQGGVDPKRVDAIAATLPEKPFAFGRPVSDRATWQRLAKTKQYANVIPNAEKILKTPMPDMTEDVFLEYKRTGQRTRHYADVRTGRHSRIATFTLAECVENKGRFIKPLEETIASVCAEPTWVFNFHDPDLLNWKGKLVGIDLGSILPAHDLAVSVHLLGDKLSPETRALIEKETRRRILAPYRNAVEGSGEKWAWWITTENNWNAVCHFGVVGTALQFGKDRNERAWYVASAEKYLQNFLRGFGPDGYCAEGMGYWSYGFGNYTYLCELVLQATGGKVDWYADPATRLVALYPPRLETINGVWPAYADCPVNPKPSAQLMSFLNRHYALGLKDWNISDFTTPGGGLPNAMMLSNPNSATESSRRVRSAATARVLSETQTPSEPASQPFHELRTFFDHGGVLTCRPAPDSKSQFAASFKGGYNDEPHNHNDLGSFVVVVGDQSLLLDPGGEVYTARTFGKDRYQSNLLNSYGHSVPVVAGKLQRAGKDARAKVLRTDFTDAADTFELDLKSAYAVPELKDLRRTFTYHRTGAGSLTVRDDFTFSSPQTFATALLTYGRWTRVGDNRLLVTQNGKAVMVSIDAPNGAKVTLKDETINEQTHTGAKPTRIAITLPTSLTNGSLTLTITPADATTP